MKTSILSLFSAALILTACNGGGAQVASLTCDAEALGSDVGAEVASGAFGEAIEGDTGDWDTASMFFADTDAGGGVKYFAWQPPSAGRFSIDTEGSNFDTVLAARVGACDAPVITVNDDWDGLQSRIGLDADRDELIILQLTGYSRWDYGDYVLNITPAE